VTVVNCVAELREVYDRYGEEMLKTGVPPEALDELQIKKGTKASGGYRFSGNTLEIFDKFFGTDNPFTITLDSKLYNINLFHVDKGNQISAIEQIQKETETISLEPRDLFVTVECTLEEFYYGCQKEISFKRHILNASNADTVV